MNPAIKAIIFASVAAVGNALFVLGQKKSEVHANPFIFLAFSLSLCIVLLISASAVFPVPDLKSYLISNWKAICTTAVGLFITYLGFYFLYSRFGASYYILYAVVSIITTSIGVGVLYFREAFNIYYLLSIFSALATIILFYLGQNKS